MRRLNQKNVSLLLIGIILISGCVQNTSNGTDASGTTPTKEEVKSIVTSNDLGLPTKEEAESFGFSFVKESGVTTVKLLEQKFGTDKAELERVEKVAGYPTPISGLSRQFNIQKSDGTISKAIDSTINIFETSDKAKEYYTWNEANINVENVVAEPKFGEESIIEKITYSRSNITNFLLIFRQDKTIVELRFNEKSIDANINPLTMFGRLIENKISANEAN